MENIETIEDISKETLTFLSFFDSKMIEKIPGSVIKKLCEEAAESKQDFYIDVNENFANQKISEKSKDLIALIYYDYIADEDEKKEILNQWNINEKNYREIKKIKYNYDNIFENRKKTTSVELVETKQETLLEKIKTILRKVFKFLN
ncbi:MAG: hypothetical protein V8R81_01485 [Clostridia bacterium]